MRYQRVHWVHEVADEPVVLYAELDDDGWEVRKVDQYIDGRLVRAGPSEESGGTRLSEAPVLTIAEINQDVQFAAGAISPDEFERVWSDAGEAAPGGIPGR